MVLLDRLQVLTSSLRPANDLTGGSGRALYDRWCHRVRYRQISKPTSTSVIGREAEAAATGHNVCFCQKAHFSSASGMSAESGRNSQPMAANTAFRQSLPKLALQRIHSRLLTIVPRLDAAQRSRHRGDAQIVAKPPRQDEFRNRINDLVRKQHFTGCESRFPSQSTSK